MSSEKSQSKIQFENQADGKKDDCFISMENRFLR